MATSTKPKSDKDYIALAKKRVTRPQTDISRRRFLFYGRNKKGKSTLAASAGIARTLILDPEHGTDAMMKNNPYRWPIGRWEDMDEIWGALRTGLLSPAILELGPEKEPFSWVSVDGLTKINNYGLRYIMKLGEETNLDRRPGIVDRRDYNKSGQLMKEMLGKFHNLPMGVVFTAQERMMSMDAGDSDEDDESTFFVADLPASVRSEVNGLVEVIGRIYTTPVETKNGPRTQRRLQIGVHQRYDTGYRSDFLLPDVVKNPTIPKLVSLITTGKLPERQVQPSGQ